jgi:hypothetical protein
MEGRPRPECGPVWRGVAVRRSSGCVTVCTPRRRVTQESSGLGLYNVEYMYAPRNDGGGGGFGSDMLLGASKQKHLIMWQYNPQAAYR